MLPTTTDRVPASTAEGVNQRIERRTEEGGLRTAAAGPGAIESRRCRACAG